MVVPIFEVYIVFQVLYEFSNDTGSEAASTLSEVLNTVAVQIFNN